MSRFLSFILLLFCFQAFSEETAILSEEVESRLHKFIHFDQTSSNTVGYIFIGGHDTSISESTYLYVHQALEWYKKHPPLFIILELNTPGGEVFAAQKISDALKEMDTQYGVPVVAYINNWAISAGAMLAYSCRFITTAKDGSMGAAEPVYAGVEGKMESASEKVNSAIRADFASRAQFFDRNPLIAEAMVDKDMLLVMRESKIIQLQNEAQEKGDAEDQLISQKGKLLTLTAEQMLRYGVADLIVPPVRVPSMSFEEQSSGKWSGLEMPLFHAPFFSTIPDVTVDAYQMDWKTRFFVFLATPLISSLLFMGLLIGAYMEINHPGLGFPGLVAAVSLFLIILSSYALELSGSLEVILLITGLLLVVIELFFLPTFGFLAVLGSVLFLAGFLGMLLPSVKDIHFVGDAHELNAAGVYFLKRVAELSSAFLLSIAIIILLAKTVLPASALWSPLVLKGSEQESLKGFIAGQPRDQLPKKGAKGVVFAAMRPSGKIMIEDQIFDAMSTGEYIPEGEDIEVVDIQEGTLFIKRVLREGS